MSTFGSTLLQLYDYLCKTAIWPMQYPFSASLQSIDLQYFPVDVTAQQIHRTPPAHRPRPVARPQVRPLKIRPQAQPGSHRPLHPAAGAQPLPQHPFAADQPGLLPHPRLPLLPRPLNHRQVGRHPLPQLLGPLFPSRAHHAPAAAVLQQVLLHDLPHGRNAPPAASPLRPLPQVLQQPPAPLPAQTLKRHRQPCVNTGRGGKEEGAGRSLEGHKAVVVIARLQDRLKSQLQFVPADAGGVVFFALDEDALVVVIEQGDGRVVDVLPELDLGLARAHLHLVHLSLALLQDYLVGRPVLLGLLAERVAAEDQDEVPALGLEDARVEVELQPPVEGNHRPLLGLQRVDLRGRGPVAPEVRGITVLNPPHPSELENVLVLVGGDGVPAGALAETVDDVDLIIMKRYKFLALDQAALPLVLPSDYVDLPVQQTHPEVLTLRLHRFHNREGLLRALQVLVLHDQLRGLLALADDVVAAALRVVD